MKQTDAQVKERIDEILADERIHYSAANVFTNAPLALIQHGMVSELHALQKVMGEPQTNMNELRETYKNRKK